MFMKHFRKSIFVLPAVLVLAMFMFIPGASAEAANSGFSAADVRKVTAVNTSAGAVNPYAVAAGDTVTVTVQLSTAEAEISNLIFAGKAFAFTPSTDTEGYCTYTAVVTVLSGGQDLNTAEKVMFSFTVGGVEINQDSEMVNAQAPGGTVLTRYASLDNSKLSATVSVPSESPLPKGYATIGDVLEISVVGVPSGRNYTVKSLKIGEKTVSSVQIADGCLTYTLDGSEGFDSGDKLSVELAICDVTGTVYPITKTNAGDLTYAVRSVKPEDNLKITFDAAFDGTASSAGHWGVSEYSSMSFEFYTNEIHPGEYEVALTAKDGRGTYRVKLSHDSAAYPNDGPLAGYHYKGSVGIGDIDELIGIRDLEIIEPSVICGSSVLDSAAIGLGGADIVYYGDFDLLSLDVEYPDGKGAQKWEPGPDGNAYIVDGDFIKVTMIFNHSLTPAKTTLSMDRLCGQLIDEAAVEGYVSSPKDFTYDMGLQYCIRTTNVPDDTAVLIYRVPDATRDENYGSNRLSFQREDKTAPISRDNVPFGINLTTERLQVPNRQASIDTQEYGAEPDAGTRPYHNMVYWAPFDIWNPGIALLNLGPDGTAPIDDLDEEAYTIVRDGQQISITFSTKHAINVDEITTQLSAGGTAVSRAPEVELDYELVDDGNSRFVYKATLEIGDAPLAGLADQTVIKFILKAKDIRGQASDKTSYSQAAAWAVYYKPLEITEVTVTTSNRKDGTLFCKDGDTVTVSFKANHFVTMDGQTVAGHPGVYTENRRRHREAAEYRFTYELQNGDLKDLELVTFAFRAEDLAGEAFDFSDKSPDVINRIKYYAPLEVSAEIKSDNARPEYAKNGDTVTVSTLTSHEAQTRDFCIGGRELGDNESYRKNPVVSYRIPQDETELYEGEIFFSLRAEDPAGNYKAVTAAYGDAAGKEAAAVTGKVIYDRTAPEVRIMPGFNGFTNEDIALSILYSDLYLDTGTVSCVLNGAERIVPRGGTDTTYTHAIEMTEEGEYAVRAIAKDMAGNEMRFAAVCNLIIDKTRPVINVRLDRNTFKAGFTLDTITGIVEENLDSMICTLTDGDSVYDWALDMPIEKEGKKTVQTLLRDMAGNTSVPLVYDIFIDATAPQPQIINTATSEQLSTGERNVFAGSSAGMAMSLAPIFMGDEGPDKFTILRLLDENGAVVQDLLVGANGSETYSCGLPAFGNYTLLVEAADDVGNETGPLLYMIEFREQSLFERLVENTPLERLPFAHYVSDPIFFGICIFLLLLMAGIFWFIIWKRRKKKEYMEQEFVIVDEE